jgi:hypothetical protein
MTLDLARQFLSASNANEKYQVSDDNNTHPCISLLLALPQGNAFITASRRVRAYSRELQQNERYSQPKTLVY